MKNGQSFLGWLQNDAKYVPRNIIEGVKNLIKWFPLVWKDADWDHYYIMQALRFKIKNTADYIEKHKRYENWERDVERMRLCVRLFDALHDDIYELEYQDYYSSGMFDEPIKDDLKTYLAKYPNEYRRIEKDTEIRDALRLGGNGHKRATKILFTLIERNIYYWWD